ncbi:MAG: TRAP transporter fused permease subunit [Acidobacteriota bacterium]
MWRHNIIRSLSVLLCLFIVAEVNYPLLRPHTQLSIFALLGLAITFLIKPVHPRVADAGWARTLDGVMVALTAAVFGYVAVQSEPIFSSLWRGGASLGDRAGAESSLDIAVAVIGLVLVLEASRRAVGWALPILSLLFLAYARWGSAMPDWLFPHRGYGYERVVSQAFLHGQGVFGVAMKVMFTYVFLFVVFGAILELTGATRFVIEYARRLLGGTAGGPAKVAILSSGLMGSLSGSAVANTATTGTFTIPLMRSGGFSKHQAAGIEAAASSGGALVPPVMGAGAYMMLEIVVPPTTILQIIQAAILPAVLYYLSLFLIAHFSAKRLEASADGVTEEKVAEETPEGGDAAMPGALEGIIFFGSLGSLVVLLLSGFTVFRSVTLAMAVAVVLSQLSGPTRLGFSRLVEACTRAARGGVALVAAAASVGIVMGVVTLTGVGSKLPATILPLAEQNLFLALLLIMFSSIVLGMGLPSAVCYLLLATLIGPAIGDLGVVPLAAHFFIFYFGLMSMVTPPVALAAYTAASIAESPIMKTAFAAFRFSLVGFFLPYLFVYRPQLLMLDADGGAAGPLAIAAAFLVAAAGIVPLSASIAGFGRGRLAMVPRLLLFAVALLVLMPAGRLAVLPIAPINLVGMALAAVLFWTLGAKRREAAAA